MLIKDIISDLVSELDDLKAKFLDHHLTAATIETPDEYRLDVRAFAVLAHAAMEQAFEDLCETVADSAAAEYATKGAITAVTLSLVAFIGAPIQIKTEDTSIALNPRENHLKALCTSVKEYKQTIILRNQGMSCKYLGKLLAPIAISTIPDVDELDAINQLKDIRGESAHRYQARLVPDPTVMLQHVGFCHRYFGKVADEAAALIGEIV